MSQINTNIDTNVSETTGVTTTPKSTTSTTVATLKLPPLPTTPAEVATFMITGSIAIDTAKKIIATCPANSGLFFKALEFGQRVAGMVLDEGMKIADEVRAAGSTKGSGLAINASRAKKSAIMTAYGFTKNKMWRNICELDANCVDNAKIFAKSRDDIPSINMALTMKKKLKPKKKRLSVYEGCNGKFSDVVLPFGLKFPELTNMTSLFSNIGIGTYRLNDINGNVAVANELDSIRSDIHRMLFPSSNVITGSITEDNIFQQIVDAHKKNDCRFVLMSPPCQSYSKAGSQNVNRNDAILVMRGMEFVKAVNDNNDGFMCENVPEFFGGCPEKIREAGYDNILSYMKNVSEKLGYITNADYLNAKWFGTAEDRNRAIFLGLKKEFVEKIIGKEPTAENVWKFPKKDEIEFSELECLAGIPSLEAGQSRIEFNRLHFAPDLAPEIVEALKDTEAGQETTIEIKDDDGVISLITIARAKCNKPAPTITGESSHYGAPANYFPAGRIKIDGTQSDARYRTPYEILVLSGMPRDFELPEKIKIRDGNGNIWCKNGLLPESDPTAIQPGDIVVTDDEFRTMLGEHYCPTVVNRCFAQLIYQIQNKDF